MNTSGILRLGLELGLQLGQIPSGKLLVSVCVQFAIDKIYLSLDISNQISPLLDVPHDIIRQDLPKHGYKVIVR